MSSGTEDVAALCAITFGDCGMDPAYCYEVLMKDVNKMVVLCVKLHLFRLFEMTRPGALSQ